MQASTSVYESLGILFEMLASLRNLLLSLSSLDTTTMQETNNNRALQRHSLFSIIMEPVKGRRDALECNHRQDGLSLCSPSLVRSTLRGRTRTEKKEREPAVGLNIYPLSGTRTPGRHICYLSSTKHRYRFGSKFPSDAIIFDCQTMPSASLESSVCHDS